MKNLPFFALLLFVFLSSCARQRYQTAAYDRLSDQHLTLAVLPSQTIMTGRIPPEMSEADRLRIEENESYAFQVAIFDEVTERSGTRSNDIVIDLQHYSETNSKLREAGLSLRESWDMSPTELAEILGVDAVIRTSIRKDMFLTDLESFGVNVAWQVLSTLGANPLPFLITDKTSDVFLSAAVIDGSSGISVWSTDKTVATDWNTRHSEIVRRLARIMARRFPYRAY
jgi:hypothetical protein